jgi:hypothetical protein
MEKKVHHLSFWNPILWIALSPVIAFLIVSQVNTYQFQLGSPSLFLGTWINSSSTKSITKVIVSADRNGGLFQIHFFGSCIPTYCDWGVTRGYYNNKVIQGTYLFYFKTTKFTLSLTDNGKLEVTQVNYYNDGRPKSVQIFRDILQHI